MLDRETGRRPEAEIRNEGVNADRYPITNTLNGSLDARVSGDRPAGLSCRSDRSVRVRRRDPPLLPTAFDGSTQRSPHPDAPPIQAAGGSE
ncbi:hypothetical protein [Roseiarcus fermentans]|uniref:hypothetical protein n=1 Tax=Roseiarcus fermentans TaxID=1473586 RepID=UPI0011BE1E76|nr:hypothetical protein [Roseiarcus fermentans]